MMLSNRDGTGSQERTDNQEYADMEENDKQTGESRVATFLSVPY